MSYDLEIAAHGRPTREQIEGWAGEQGLIVEENGTDSFSVSRRTRRGDGFLFDVDGPFAAEPEDFDEAVAAACLAPRWMLTVSVPYSRPKRAFSLARALARRLAEANAGAAFDPQEDGLIWPRGRARRVPPRSEEETTSLVRLAWFVPQERWQPAPRVLVDLLSRHCPEALPTRYGQWEPLQHRFDPDAPDEFVRFLVENEDGDAFWFARRPSFGGSFNAPHAARFTPPEEEHLRVARVTVDFDGRVLEEDERWREAVVDLFVRAASSFGAFFAAAQVEPGWTVTRNNRLYATAATLPEGAEHILRGLLWQGLPPVPVWLSWFGGPYRERVAPVLTNERSADRRVETHPDGILVRLGEEPRPNSELQPLPLPPELTYRYRPPMVENPDGSVSSTVAERGDEARVIPPLGG